MLLSLLSDFGGAEEWVASVKGAVLARAPEARFLDIAHDIGPYDIAKGALVLAAALPALPVGVHLAVVDPGVGTARRALALACERGDMLVGPDNGLLLPAAGRLGGMRAVFSIEESAGEEPAHPTFHARDVFAPAAAHLLTGGDPALLGPPLDPAALVAAPFHEALCADGAIYARVIDVDRFGSLRLDAPWGALERAGIAGASGVLVDIADTIWECDLVDTFGDASSELALYRDSAGVLGVAAERGRAEAITGGRSGTAVFIYRR
ncbi:MAG: SAM hydrolase/SAM-dependent halogenase family protein [Candidatus Geothermincolia bacterium]